MMRNQQFAFGLLAFALLMVLAFSGRWGLPGRTPVLPSPQQVEFHLGLGKNQTNMGQMQAILDTASQAALNGQWSCAAADVQQLKRIWAMMEPEIGGERLQIVQNVNTKLLALQYSAWGRDQSGFLRTASNLTGQFDQLNQEG